MNTLSQRERMKRLAKHIEEQVATADKLRTNNARFRRSEMVLLAAELILREREDASGGDTPVSLRISRDQLWTQLTAMGLRARDLESRATHIAIASWEPVIWTRLWVSSAPSADARHGRGLSGVEILDRAVFGKLAAQAERLRNPRERHPAVVAAEEAAKAIRAALEPETDEHNP